jgi:hypothetical protein
LVRYSSDRGQLEHASLELPDLFVMAPPGYRSHFLLAKLTKSGSSRLDTYMQGSLQIKGTISIILSVYTAYFQMLQRY